MGDQEKPESPTAMDTDDMDVEAEEEEDTPSVSSDDPAELSDSEPSPKYQPAQRVYAKDVSAGLWYEAVVRRFLYGVNHNKQVQIGLVSNESEIEDILSQAKNEESFHYFVHYNNWNVNWDRWVSEEDIMEDNEQSKRIAQRFAQEHKQLQKEMKNTKGKAKDGTAFLKAWRVRMDQIKEEMDKEQQAIEAAAKDEKNTKQGDSKEIKDDTKSETKNKSDEKSANDNKVAKAKPKAKEKKKHDKTWDKGAVDQEYKLRLRGLEGKNCASTRYKVTIPFSLKKVMVDAWETITQCEMVADLPVTMTVRQALDKYLQTKLDLIATQTKIIMAKKADVQSKDGKEDNKENNDGEIADEAKENEKDAEEEKHLEELENLAKRKQEWIDMVEGIAMFFDDALPFRLLYSQELPQFKVVESTMVVTVEADETESANQPPEDTLVKMEETQKDDENMACETSPEKDTSLKETESSIPEGPPTSSKTKVEDGIQEAVSSTTTIDVIPDAPNKSNGDQEQDVKPTEPTSDQKLDSTETEQPTMDATKSESNKKPAAETHPMAPSDVYGCEHLLRFFVKVPDLLAEEYSKLAQVEAGGEAVEAFEKETKQVLAKINDLIRFFHKNQSTFFKDSYRRQNEAERREQQKWIRFVERKRKRAMEEQEEESAKKVTANNSATTSDNEDAGVATKLQKVN